MAKTTAAHTGTTKPLVVADSGFPNSHQPVVLHGGNSFSDLAANATTTVKSGVGVLHTVTINTKGASANTLTLYDNTAASGTKIATIDTTAGVTTLIYDVAFATGLTAVIATGTAADVTLSYR